jgi:hypothetical protein
MKSTEDFKHRLPLITFLNSAERGLVKEWSMERNPVENPNIKVYVDKPRYTIQDFKQAYEWTQKNKNIIHMF